MRVGETLTIALPLALEIVERMLEAGDRAERRHDDGQLDLNLGVGADQGGAVPVAGRKRSRV